MVKLSQTLFNILQHQTTNIVITNLTTTNMPIIINTEELPSTCNSWGFGGSYDRKEFTMSNGDKWRCGTAGYRHAPPHQYIQLVRANSEDVFGMRSSYDRALRGSPQKHIQKYYDKLDTK